MSALTQILQFIVALGLCFGVIWLQLNSARLGSYRRSVAARAFGAYAAVLQRWVPEPLRMHVYAYHGKRALRRLRERKG